jgi:SAM-dependent methyltransferase
MPEVANDAQRIGPVRYGASPVIARHDAPLADRYTTEAVGVLDAEERARFLDGAGVARDEESLRWQLLYRIEPELYACLVAGERLHEGVVDWLPTHLDRVLEVGAGTGRLTLDVARRAAHVTAVEPAAPLRHILRARLAAAGLENVDVVRGFFDHLPAASSYDLVVSCSAFCPQAEADPARCLHTMESACRPGGVIVVIWPSDVEWLAVQGFEHVVFAGPMLVEYASAVEAVALARIFYPAAATAVARLGSRLVDFATLGLDAPRDLCWKRNV